MEHDILSGWFVMVLVSEAIAIWLIWKLWRSGDDLFFKVSLSVIALIPIVGPVLTLWIGNFPTIQPTVLQDRVPKRTDFYDRWRHVLEEKSPIRRYRKWRELMERQDRDR